MGTLNFPYLRRLSWSALACAFTALLSSAPASAFTYLYCAAPTTCDKWDSNTVGTGAVVTWSLITDPVSINTQYQSTPPSDQLAFLSGTNQLATLRSSLGTASFDAAVQRAFDTWSQAANITFQKVADNGAQFAGSTAIDIRIGAFAFANASTGGAGFGPPGDDLNFPDQLAGDIALNSSNRFTIDTDAEGSALPTDNGIYLNDIEGLLLHEIGHTLGLGHSDVANSIMCGYLSPAIDGSQCDYTHVAHQLRADDLAGIQPLYGPTPVPLPAAAWLMLSGLAGVGAAARRRRSQPHEVG